MPIPAFAVITGRRKFDLAIDLICTTKGDARRHAAELRHKFGCDDVRVKEFADESQAYDWLELNT